MTLTKQDWELIPMLRLELSDKEIADVLLVPAARVNERVRRLRVRVGAQTRAQLVHLLRFVAAPAPLPPRPVVRVPWDEPEVIAARRAVLLGEEA